MSKLVKSKGFILSLACALTLSAVAPTVFADDQSDDNQTNNDYADPGFNFAGASYRAKATAYFPFNDAMQGGFLDRKGAPLTTLQQYLRGEAAYVSVAMDTGAFAYGTRLRIPEVEARFGRVIEFRVVDTGGAFRGRGTSRIDVCVESREASREPVLNLPVTLVVQ